MKEIEKKSKRKETPKKSLKKSAKKTPKKVVKKKKTKLKKLSANLSLDQIENEMTKLVLNTNNKNFFINSKQMEMLDKLAQTKLKRMQIEAQINKDKEEELKPEPLKIEFVSSKTVECVDRVAKIEASINNGRKNDA